MLKDVHKHYIQDFLCHHHHPYYSNLGWSYKIHIDIQNIDQD